MEGRERRRADKGVSGGSGDSECPKHGCFGGRFVAVVAVFAVLMLLSEGKLTSVSEMGSMFLVISKLPLGIHVNAKKSFRIQLHALKCGSFDWSIESNMPL